MIRRIPLLPTLIVLIAVGIMIRLGFWQIDRMHEKDALLARYAEASSKDPGVLGPGKWSAINPSSAAYMRVSGECKPIGKPQLVAGRNASGQLGYVAAVPCRLFGFDWGGSYVLVLGWTAKVDAIEWVGGSYEGTLVPFKKASIVQPDEVHSGYDNFDQADAHIVADPPLAGLEPNARPDPNDIPNNHWSYAIQWFLFALTALVIYGIALRKRMGS